MTGIPALPKIGNVYWASMKIHGLFNNTQGKQERCAVLVGEKSKDGWVIDSVIEVPNGSETPGDTFQIKSSAVKEAGIDINRVIGCVHTHNKGSGHQPSARDVDNLEPEQLGAVYHVTSKRVVWYDYDNGYLSTEEMNDGK